MRKMTVPLAVAGTAALITAALMFMVSNTVSLHAQGRPVSSYGEDRAAIEDLQARYLFALDFHDPDLYVSAFTPVGVLDYGSGEVKGREAIKEVIARMPKPVATPGLRTPAARHNISNIVIKVDGDKGGLTLVLVPLFQRQPATQGSLRRVRALRRRASEGQWEMAVHKAEDLQRRA